MNLKEEKKESLEIDLLSGSFEEAARILSSLKIEHIDFSSETLRALLLETFPDLSKPQVERLIEVFSRKEEDKKNE